MAIIPFKIHIPDSELHLLRRKLELARLPEETVDWRDDNGIDTKSIHKTIQFWLKSYDWRTEEAKLNELPQFKTIIEVDDGFGNIDIHFVHSKSFNEDAIPLLFLHGWPGSFMEVSKGLPLLNKAGFHVVAPSLPGYGFSSYPRKAGFGIRKHAEVMNKLMINLGYECYVIQGGDWGAHIVQAIGVLHPENAKATHQNMLMMFKPSFPDGEPEYTPFEQHCLDRLNNWFFKTNSAYGSIQATKPLTLGYAMHDSPVGMLVWMMDKLYLWSDSYPWTQTELITWTLLHYFPGPTTAFMIYKEDAIPDTMVENSWAQEYSKVPHGFSAFPKEIGIVPRSWAEKMSNILFWREHASGGHFAMYEKPEELVSDVVEFFRSVWNKG